MLKGSGANLQALHTEYNLESMAQAKFNDSVLVFHSHWKNCYSHILKVLPSDIRAGSIGVVMREEDRERMKNLITELRKAMGTQIC